MGYVQQKASVLFDIYLVNFFLTPEYLQKARTYDSDRSLKSYLRLKLIFFRCSMHRGKDLSVSLLPSGEGEGRPVRAAESASDAAVTDSPCSTDPHTIQVRHVTGRVGLGTAIPGFPVNKLQHDPARVVCVYLPGLSLDRGSRAPIIAE